MQEVWINFSWKRTEKSSRQKIVSVCRSQGTSEEQIAETLKRMGITYVPREATPEDLVEGLPQPQRALLLEEFKKLQHKKLGNKEREV